MKKERKGKHFIKKPIYPGGLKAMKEFIRTHRKYPKQAAENGIEGTVRVKYDIDYKGNVVGTQVQSSLGYGCDEEAVRIVKLLKFEVPKTRKVKVLFHKTINMHFKKPKQKKVQVKMTYSYSTKPKVKEAPKDKKKSSYSYTIINK